MQIYHQSDENSFSYPSWKKQFIAACGANPILIYDLQADTKNYAKHILRESVKKFPYTWG